jgi:AraC-like DNA-binding protein
MTQLQTSARTSTRSDIPTLRSVRHDSELGSWESIFREPDPRLKGLLDGPYHGWIERTTGTMLRREVPSSIVPLIINLGPAYRLIDPTDRTRPPRCLNSFVAGMHDSCALVESGGFAICVQVNFRAIGAWQFLGVPMDSLTNRVVEFEDILGPSARRLISQMQNASDWMSRFDLLERFLLTRFENAAPASPSVSWAWRKLNETGGLVSVGDLATELGRSRKHLIAQFRREVGMPPKTLARIIRFGRVTKALERDHIKSWVQVAYHCGYYDQAHLIRDFREFAGTTPTEYLGRLLPDGGGLAAP